MSAYYIHDGRNEIGPFTIDLLKKQKLTRNTPIRQLGSDHWMPAERLAPLKELVAPRKIRRPKDILPATKEHFHYLRERKPILFYCLLLFLPLVTSVAVYTVTKIDVKPPVQTVMPTPKLTAEIITPAQKEMQPVAVQPTVAVQPPSAAKEDVAKTSRKRWNRLITATNSSYGIGFLGGIKDLSVMVSNRTDFPIDMAVVKVTYIKASGGVWKTVPVTLYNIPAHDSKELALPDVSRGKKVKVSIQKIVSKKMKFSYTEGQKVRNPDDPYVL